MNQKFRDQKINEFYAECINVIENIAAIGEMEYKLDITNQLMGFGDIVKKFENDGFVITERSCESRSCGQSEDCSLCGQFYLFLVSWKDFEVVK